jgi:hypothetical protein
MNLPLNVTRSYISVITRATEPSESVCAPRPPCLLHITFNVIVQFTPKGHKSIINGNEQSLHGAEFFVRTRLFHWSKPHGCFNPRSLIVSICIESHHARLVCPHTQQLVFLHDLQAWALPTGYLYTNVISGAHVQTVMQSVRAGMPSSSAEALKCPEYALVSKSQFCVQQTSQWEAPPFHASPAARGWCEVTKIYLPFEMQKYGYSCIWKEGHATLRGLWVSTLERDSSYWVILHVRLSFSCLEHV